MGDYKDNNIVTVAGIVEETPVFNHEVYKEKFYIFPLRVKRLSEVDDHIKVILSERLFGSGFDVRAGDFVEVNGQFRSYNNYSGEGSRLVLTVFAKDIRTAEPEELENPNQIFLDGFVCKTPVYRRNPIRAGNLGYLACGQPLVQQVRLHTGHRMGPEREVLPRHWRRRAGAYLGKDTVARVSEEA